MNSYLVINEGKGKKEGEYTSKQGNLTVIKRKKIKAIRSFQR